MMNIDTGVFLFINHLPHTAISDGVAKFFSLIGTAGIVWLVIGGLLFLKEERKHHLFFAPIVAAGGISYVLVELIVKPLVARMRPSVEMGAIIVGNVKNDFSFPSGHATIAFAMAVVLSECEPKWKGWFITLAVAIALSRVYIGVHYPLDVVFGALLGWGIGVNILWIRKRYHTTTHSQD